MHDDGLRMRVREICKLLPEIIGGNRARRIIRIIDKQHARTFGTTQVRQEAVLLQEGQCSDISIAENRRTLRVNRIGR